MNTLFRAFGVVVSAVILVAGMASCAKDTDVADPYANWEERNVAFIDSIADVAANPPEGEIWRKYLDYRIDFENDLNAINPYQPKVDDYVYVKYKNEEDILEEDAITEFPIMYSDTVMIAYQGFLINGTRFDGTYHGNFDIEVIDNFRKLNVGGSMIPGWTIALLHMKPNTKDKVEVYIPQKIGYADTPRDGIPVKSDLKFEMYVDEVIKPKLQE